MGKAPVRVLITGAAGKNEREAAGKCVKRSVQNGLCSSQPPAELSSVALAGSDWTQSDTVLIWSGCVVQ